MRQDGVSIHTRHCCRVMRHLHTHVLIDLEVSIHTRHRCRVMRRAVSISSAPQGFNPHPALLPGDARATRGWFDSSNGFNPHPALLPGDAQPESLSTMIMRFQSTPGIAAG